MSDPTLVMIETTAAETPAGGFAIVCLSTHDQGFLSGARPVGYEVSDEFSMFLQTAPETPEGGFGLYTLGTLQEGGDFGHVRGDVFGNVWSDQKRRGAIA